MMSNTYPTTGQPSTSRHAQRRPSRADILPINHSSTQNQEPRYLIANPVQRSVHHARNQYGKARPINTSRLDHGILGKSLIFPRPPPEPGNISIRTRYTEMLSNLDTIPRFYDVFAAFFTWILLAGLVIFPGTFTSPRELSVDSTPTVAHSNQLLVITVIDRVRNVPLVVIASICCGAGILGITWLAIRWRDNYIWPLNRLYLPGVMNGLIGLVSTLVSVYTNQRGYWSATAKTAVVLEGFVMAVCGALFILYNNLLLASVRRKHEAEVGKTQGNEHLLEKTGRKPNEPTLEPGNMV